MPRSTGDPVSLPHSASLRDATIQAANTLICAHESPSPNQNRRRPRRSNGALAGQKCIAEGLKQRAIDGIVLWIVLSMPLNAECKARRVGDSNRLNRAVFGHSLDHNPLARFQDALTVKRVYADGLPTEDPRKRAPRNESDIMAIAEDDVGIRMDFSCLQARHAMVHASR